MLSQLGQAKSRPGREPAMHVVYPIRGGYFGCVRYRLSYRAGSWGARRLGQDGRGHSIQLSKPFSAPKRMPDTVLVGTISRLSVSLTPMVDSVSPSSWKSDDCCSIGQSLREPGLMRAVSPCPKLSWR